MAFDLYEIFFVILFFDYFLIFDPQKIAENALNPVEFPLKTSQISQIELCKIPHR